MSEIDGYCGNCEVDRFRYQRIIRRLTEKLEYSQLQNENLAAECNRLRELLAYSEWQGRSRIPFDVQKLPSEMWREIFAFATSINGLAYSHWDNKDANSEWDISQITRHSIPLVCRAWNLAGSSFLYEHLVLTRLEQLQQLGEVLAKAEENGCGSAYRSWIQALELVPGPRLEPRREFFQLAAELLERYRFPHLTIFGIDSNVEPIDAKLVLPVVSTAIQTYHQQLEYLHLPATENSWMWGDVFSESPPEHLRLPHLHTLSMTPGKWVMSRDRLIQYFGALTTTTLRPALRTLSVEWFKVEKRIFFDFLRTIPQLHTFHCGKSSFLDTVCELPTILELLPYLKQIYLEYAPPTGRDIVTRDTILLPEMHINLSKIVIQAGRTGCLDFIDTLKGLFSMIEEVCFPQLETVEIQLQNSRSCVDEVVGYPEVDRAAWRRAIRICATAGVLLTSPSGNPIHLWSDRHGIKRDPRVEKRQEQLPSGASTQEDASEQEDTGGEDKTDGEEEEEGMSNGSEEESEDKDSESYDTDDEVYTHSEHDSVFDSINPQPISDDSEDAEFEPWDQPDIEFDTDQEESMGSPLQVDDTAPFFFLT